MGIVKTYKLFLDDIRSLEETYSYTRYESFLNDEWEIVRDYKQFVDHIQHNWDTYKAFPDMIAFDHDLDDTHYMPQELWGTDYDKWAEEQGFDEKTGMDCAHWLVDFCMDNNLTLPDWICHSMNPAGRDNINHLLLNFRKHQNGREN